MFIIEDEKRNNACKDLERKFAERFPGLQLIWDEVNKNNLEKWQKFALKEMVEGQKIRLVFVTNDAFENDEMGSFLIQFKDHLEEFTQKSTKAIRYREERLEIDKLYSK